MSLKWYLIILLPRIEGKPFFSFKLPLHTAHSSILKRSHASKAFHFLLTCFIDVHCKKNDVKVFQFYLPFCETKNYDVPLFDRIREILHDIPKCFCLELEMEMVQGAISSDIFPQCLSLEWPLMDPSIRNGGDQSHKSVEWFCRGWSPLSFRVVVQRITSSGWMSVDWVETPPTTTTVGRRGTKRNRCIRLDYIKGGKGWRK